MDYMLFFERDKINMIIFAFTHIESPKTKAMTFK